MRGDGYTARVRQFLTALEYSAHGWGLGVNLGPTRRLLEGSADRLIELTDKPDKASIVGFSMGGLFARWLALQLPERIRQIITVCSPIHDAAANFWLPLKPLLTMWPGKDLAKLAEEVAQPVSVPTTCLFSRDDGVVNWPACHDDGLPEDDLIEIAGPHALIARNPFVMAVLAERLARRIECVDSLGPVERPPDRLAP